MLRWTGQICTLYRVSHKYLNDFFSNGCGIQMSQATPTKFSMPFKHNYGKLSWKFGDHSFNFSFVHGPSWLRVLESIHSSVDILLDLTHSTEILSWKKIIEPVESSKTKKWHSLDSLEFSSLWFKRVPSTRRVFLKEYCNSCAF